jgi:hypothetical protein
VRRLCYRGAALRWSSGTGGAGCDTPGGRWRVDHAFEEHLQNGRWRDLAVGVDRNGRDYFRILMIFWEHDLPNR